MEEENKERRQKIYKTIMLVVLTAFITFMITSLTLYTKYTNSSASGLLEGAKEAIFSGSSASNLTTYIEKVKKIISSNYLYADKIDEDKLEKSAVEGYVSGLGDDYTEYIPADEMNEFTEDITGSFVGVGIYMIADEETQKVVVYYPIPDSPAEKAGVKAGDIIVSVDGIEYPFEEFNTIAEKIRGEAGTKVKLVVERDGKQLNFEITREKVNTNPITTEVLENNIGYLTLPSFDSGTAEKFKEKVEELKNKGIKSLIIDLRNNGGGIVDESTEIADYILEKGKTIMTTVDNKDNKEETKSKNDPIFDMPIVILTNENTASASEILTGALKDNGKAKVIGTNTYGKGVIQTVFTLTDGSGLKLTTAEYYTPNGTAINGVGIKPDIEVKLPSEITNIYSVTKEKDTQLQKAIEELGK